MAAIVILLFVHIFFRQKYRVNSDSGKRFNRLIVCIMLTAIMNIISESILVFRDRIPFILIYVVYSIYLYFVAGCSFSLFEYTRIIANGKDKITFAIIFNHILMFVHLILCIVTVFLHTYIVIPQSGPIQRGPLYVVIYIISGYYLIYSAVTMLTHFSRKGDKQIKSVVGFVVISFSGAICQYFFFGDNMIIYFIYAASTLVLLFAFETPDFEKLIRTTEELEKSQAELKEARRRELELTSTVNELSQIATWGVYFDDDGEVYDSSWSPEFVHMMGYEDGEYEGEISQLWSEALHPEDKDMAIEAFFAGAKGQDYDIEARLADKNGVYRWYECSGETKTDEDGRIRSYQGFIRDIDDEKVKEQLAAEKIAALEELEKSQTELKKALMDATEANKAKTIFLSNMSHDIRTPMNAIIGYTQLAQENVGNDREVKDCLSTIRSSGEHLLALINDVLDMSRIESGKMNIQTAPCNLVKLVDDLKNMTLANAQEKKQTFIHDYSKVVNEYVYCDRLRINQILINCIGNAIKYTQEGGTVSFSLSQESIGVEGYGEYVFSIKDNGIGMSEEFINKVFDPFERDSATRTSQIQGTGLGMAITRNLVTMMGGHIGVKSKLGEGSEFIIRIPLKTISKEDMTNVRKEVSLNVSMDEITEYLQGKNFLVVDDNRLNRRIVKRLLETRGMLVEECESGQDAIDRLNRATDGEFDAVFMDIQMPGMTGYEAVDVIRSSDREYLRNVIILAMTANAFEEDKKQAILHGMNSHVTKPFKVDELIKTIYGCLI